MENLICCMLVLSLYTVHLHIYKLYAMKTSRQALARMHIGRLCETKRQKCFMWWCCQLLPLLSVNGRWINIVMNYWGNDTDMGKLKYLEKPVPVPLHPPRTPHGLVLNVADEVTAGQSLLRALLQCSLFIWHSSVFWQVKEKEWSMLLKCLYQSLIRTFVSYDSTTVKGLISCLSYCTCKCCPQWIKNSVCTFEIWGHCTPSQTLLFFKLAWIFYF